MKSFGLTIRAFSIVLFFLVLVSCEKEPNKIGLEIQPPEDKLKVVFSDTATIISYSVFEDSVRTDELSVNLLGSNYDHIFGKTVASMTTQVLMSKAGVDFGENPKVDSLILSMVYVGYYGDLNTMQTLRVYELNEDFFRDSAYYSNRSVSHDDIDYAHHNFYPQPNDSVSVDGVVQAPQLRINLSAVSPLLADKILYAPEDALSDNDKFLEYFKGLYITCDELNYGGAILSFNMTTATSSLILYYSNDSVEEQSFEMLINDNCARFNSYDHFNYDHADQLFRKQLIYQDTMLGNNAIYLQAMGGVKTVIKFPYLLNYNASTDVAINEASLYFYNNDPESNFTAPTNLSLLKKNEDGGFSLLTDYLESAEYFGGNYAENAGSYRFRISRTVQEVMSGSLVDPELYLSITGASTIANRVVLNGSESMFTRIRLEIIYTEVN